MPWQAIAAFPDTNIFLHYRPLDEIDWRTVLQADAVNIKIAPVVTRELEEQKIFNQSRKLRDRAAAALRVLSRYLSENRVRDGVTLEFLVKEPTAESADSLNLNLRVADDQLIGTLVLYREEHPEAYCFLVTSDLSLKVKANHHQIQLAEPGDALRLPPEPDPLEKKNRDLEAELFRYKSREPILDVLFQGQKNHASFRLNRPRDADGGSESEIQSMLDKAKQHCPLVELKPEQDLRAPALLAPFGAPMRDLQDWGRRYYEDYNRRAKEYYAEYEQYLRRMLIFKTLPSRTIKLDLILFNSGTCPAEDIYVLLHFPDGFQLYDEGDPPKQPQEPAVPSKEMFPGVRLALPEYLSEIHALPRFRAPWLPKIRKTSSYDVSLECEKLQHDLLWEFSPLFVAFDSWDSVRSFSIEWSVRAGNIMRKRAGELGVKVETD